MKPWIKARDQNRKSKNSKLISNDDSRLSLLNPSLRVERFGIIISAFAQIAMIALVSYGYYSTVRPVFQKELLSEEVAELKLEKETIVSEIEQINNNLAKLNNALYEAAKLDMFPLPVEGTFLDYIRSFGIFDPEVDDPIKVWIEEIKSPDTLSSSLRKTVSNPNYGIQTWTNKLNDLIQRENGDEPMTSIYKKLLNEYEVGIKSEKANYQCSALDYSAWSNSYFDALSSFNQQCVNHFFSKRIVREGWDEEKVEEFRLSPFWNKQKTIFLKQCAQVKDNALYELDKFYLDEWSKAIAPCQTRASYINNIIFQKYDLNKLPPFGDGMPPSKELVGSKVRAMISHL